MQADALGTGAPAGLGCDPARNLLQRAAPGRLAGPLALDEIGGGFVLDRQDLPKRLALDRHLGLGQPGPVILRRAALLGEVEAPAVDLGALAGAYGRKREALEAVRAAVVGRLEERLLVGIRPLGG